MKAIKKIIFFFKKILSKFIVVPISKIILFINTKMEKPGKKLENWLSHSNTLLFISLIAAISIFIVIDQKIITYSESSAEVISSQNINVLFDEDNYVVEGIPEGVDITLIGNKADLFIAKQSPANEVKINLWGLKPGTHKVDVKYDQLSEGIKYTVNPSVATVVIYEKVSASKTLSVDLLNQDSLDQRYIIDEVKSKQDTVIIKGASYKVEKVATVKALVDIEKLPKDELGEKMTISSTLKAYDKDGNAIDVEISPAKADVDILISSPSKEVPIKVQTTGSVIYNMGISNFVINNNKQTTVKIYGANDVISSIEYIPVVINVEGLSESTNFNVELIKPTGVKYMDLETVSIDVELSNDVANTEIENVSISSINLDSNLGVTPIDIDSVNIKLKGVAGIVNEIKPEDLNVYVDLKGLGVGTHDVDIYVSGNDARVEYKTSVLKMKVKIYQK